VIVGSRTAKGRAGDVVSLSERTWGLAALRASIAAAALLVAFGVANAASLDRAAVLAATLAYVAASASSLVVGRLPRRAALALTALSLLVDGVYLAFLVYATGAAASPLRFVVPIHVIAVTLLASYRTGLKLVGWHALLRIVVPYAEASGMLRRVDAASALPSAGRALPEAALLDIAVLVAVLAVTWACSALNERELRDQRTHLEALADMMRRLEVTERPDEIGGILLETVCAVFGYSRGAVLVERDGDLAVLAEFGAHRLDIAPTGPDRSMETAWADARPVLLRRVDPEGDRRIAAMFPDGRNIVVIPMTGARSSLGVLVVERAARGGSIRRSALAMAEEFSAHAWLSLNNVWLLDDVRTALEENRALQEQLARQNDELEATVETRTAEVTQRLTELRLVDEARRDLIEKLVSAQEEERSRLAGDIHDDPVQKMVATSMRLQLLRRQVSDPDVTKTLEQLLATVKTSIASLRHLIFELRPSVLDTDGLSTALRQLLDKMQQDAGGDHEVEYQLRDELADEPPGEVRTMLYRIVQEALGNVRKHARAEHVTVVLADREGGYLARVTDDGVGFGVQEISASLPGHLGLTSMRERAELAGGWCRVQSLPSNGTSVEVWLPDPASRSSRAPAHREEGLPVPTRLLPEPARR